MRSKTLVLGASGFLGSHFKHLVNQPLQQFRFIGESRNDCEVQVDPWDFDSIKEVVDIHSIDSIINCVAVASIEFCEREPRIAFKINSDYPGELAKFCISNGIHLVHVSTDAVLKDGVALKDELSPVAPNSIYGKSKLKGETAVLRASANFSVARVNFYGASPKKNSLFDYFYDSLLNGIPTNGFIDVFFSPLYVLDTVDALMFLAKYKKSGLIHLAGSQSLSKYEFGLEVAKLLGLPSKLIIESVMQKLSDANLRTLNLSINNSSMLQFFQPKYSLEQGINHSIVNRKSASFETD